MKKILTIIPARGGSKGVIKKNIKQLVDKPLIAWSIEQALSSKYIKEVIVSTDDEDITAVAKKYGARVPFVRPDHLATDIATTADVLIHAIDELKKMGESYEYILLLEPTSPLRETTDIDTAIEILLSNKEAKSIVGVAKAESQHPSFCISLSSNGFLRSKNGFQVLRRQDIEELYYYEGSIYFSEINSFLSNKSFYHELTLGYIMPKWKALEIDDETDFVIAEAMIKNNMKNFKK